jgi:hypothetical protein
MATRTLVRAGAITCVIAAIATGVGALLLVSLLGIDPAFQPISLPSVVLFTVLYGIAATVVYGVIARRARDPRRTWIRVAVVAFVLLLIPDVSLLLGPAESPMGPVSTAGVLGLIALHCVAAPIIVLGLLTFAPSERSP